MMNKNINARKSLLALFIAFTMIFTLIPSTVAVHAAETEYTFQPVIPEGENMNSMFMIEPSDITVLSETDTEIVNQINTVIDGTKDIKFTFTMSAGMNNFNEAHFRQYNMPIIKILDSNGNVAAEYSGGAGELKFLGSVKSDEINNHGSQKTVELYIGVDKDILSTGDYTIVFGKNMCGNNIEKILGKDIKFEFFVKATSDLDVLIGEVQTFLDSVVIGDEPGQYPQSAADSLSGAILTAETELAAIDTQLADGTITSEEATTKKNTAAKTLDSALKTFKSKRVVDVQSITVKGISNKQYVGDTGAMTATVVTDPDEADYKKIRWEASDNIIIDELTGEWTATYAGEGWVRAVSRTDSTAVEEIAVDVVNEGDNFAVVLSDKAVPAITYIENALAGTDKTIDSITHLKLITIDTGLFDETSAEAIREAIPELKSLDLSGVSLTAIGTEWFADWDTLETVVLPENLVTVGIKAFYNCDGLTNIEIPATVETIGASAFAGCTALNTTFTVNSANPPSFSTAVYENLGYGDTFKGCSADVAATVKMIQVPYGCAADFKASSGWKRYRIVEMEEKALTVSYESTGGLAAAAQAALEEKGWEHNDVTSLTVICGDNAELDKTTDMAYLQTHFLGATTVDLSQANFPDNNIQSNTFKARKNVKEIVLPEGISHMGRQAFYGCINMRTITIPSTVRYVSSSNPGIGESALANCPKLTTIIMNPAEPPGYLGSLPTGLEAIYVPNLCVEDYKAAFSDQRNIILAQTSVATEPEVSVEAMDTVQLTASIDSVVPMEDNYKWEITTKQDADNPVAVIDENTGVLTACRYGTVKVKVTAGYGTMNECSATATVSVTKAPAVALIVSPESYNSIKLSWTAIDDAKGYQVFRSESSDGEYSLHETLTAANTSFTDTGIATDTTYFYKVRGYKTVNNVNVYCEYSDVQSAKTALGITTVTAARNTYNSIKVSWQAVDGATGYKVYRSASKNGTYKEIASADANTYSYIDKSRDTGTTYYYKVRALRTVNSNTAYSAYSDVKSAKTTLFAPVATAKKNTYNSNKITWSSIAGATGYKIYRSTTKDGTYKLIATKDSKVKSYVDKGRTTGTTYYYKVRAYRTVNDKLVYSAYSAVKSAKPTLAKVTKVKTAKAGTQKIKVSWAKTAGANGYEIYRSTKKNSGFAKIKTVKSGKTLNFTTGKLKKNKTYYFKVRAYRNVKVNGKTKKVYGPYSAVVYRKAK